MKRTVQILKYVFGIFAIILLLMAAFFGFGNALLCERTEVGRLSSPDDIADAVVVRTNCGATTSYAYDIYLVRKGEQVNRMLDRVFKSDHVDNLQVNWMRSKQLLITYNNAQIYEFTNFDWMRVHSDNLDYEIHITEKRTE